MTNIVNNYTFNIGTTQSASQSSDKFSKKDLKELIQLLKKQLNSDPTSGDTLTQKETDRLSYLLAKLTQSGSAKPASSEQTMQDLLDQLTGMLTEGTDDTTDESSESGDIASPANKAMSAMPSGDDAAAQKSKKYHKAMEAANTKETALTI
jgi:hypothetical protein